VTDLYNFVRELPGHVILVVDEAYREYLPQHLQPHLLRYIREGHYLLALRTFSKAYGLAGLRMGYGVGPPEMAEILNRVRQPFNVNALAQRAAVAALDDTTHLEETLRITETGRQSVQSLLEGLGLSYVPSVTNFVLVNVRTEGAAIASALFRQGVIVRSMEGYDLPTFIRVTIGTPEENIRAMEALGTVLEEMEAAVKPSSPPGRRSGK
jgi:histidinol-phosphate aminotransferase